MRIPANLLALGLALAAGGAFPGQCKAPKLPLITEAEMYESFFVQLAALEDLGARIGAAGGDPRAPELAVRMNARLTWEEENAAKSIALDCERKLAEVRARAEWLQNQRRVQAQLNGAPDPATVARISGLGAENSKIVQEHIQQLKAAFEPKRFTRLDRYIRKRMQRAGLSVAPPSGK
jgi:hypothetical protein